MAKIVYVDRDKAAPYVRFHGIDFTHGQPVEVQDDSEELLAMAAASPFFRVTQWRDEPEQPSPAARAAAPGRKRRPGSAA